MQKNILEYFFKTVATNKTKPAIKEGDRQITFEELDKQAHILADEILSKKNIRNKPVAIFLPKSIELILADISVTYSSNTYMNIDVKSPQERVKNIFNQINPSVVVTNSSLKSQLVDLMNDDDVICIDQIDFSVQSGSLLVQKNEKQIDTDPLCIINTSGSTGTPKGVVLNHRSYINYTNWATSTFNISSDFRLGVLSPPFFDHFNYEITLMMMQGVQLVLLDNNMASFPIKLLEVIERERINYIFWVPAIMVNIANMDLLDKVNLSSLRMVWFAGEVFPTKQFNIWRKNLPNVTFVNLYGPTECTVDCTYYVVDRELSDEEPIPIGFPCKNTDVLILNDRDELATSDEEGELCVRGTSLAMGYYNNPEKTAAAFVQNPLNTSYPEIIYRTGDIVAKNAFGEIVFKGRKDSLVKHLGYRIELGEIEHVIVNTLKMAKSGCVVYQTQRKEITLFYESPTEISPAEFRKQIATILPKYMIPTVYIRLDEMPRNTNGKIDRLLLKNQIN